MTSLVEWTLDKFVSTYPDWSSKKRLQIWWTAPISHLTIVIISYNGQRVHLDKAQTFIKNLFWWNVIWDPTWILIQNSRFQYSWDQFRLSIGKQTFQPCILWFHFGIQVQVKSAMEAPTHSELIFYDCTIHVQLQPTIVCFSARASGSSEVPIYLPTFKNLSKLYLCPKSNVILGFPASRRATAKFSEAPIYLTFFTDSTITLNLTAQRL